MILPTFGVHQDIINKDYDKQIQKLSKHPIQKIHESNWSINQPKGHNQELIMDITGTEISLGNINLTNLSLMIALTKIYFRETLSTLKLTKEVVNPRKRVLVFHSDLI